MQKIMTYIAYIAGAIFIVIGIALVFTDIFKMSQLPSQLKVMMGVVLLLYGLFRIVATIYKNRQRNEEL
jgi:hypothetical protein